MEEAQEEKSNPTPSPLKQIRTFQGDVANALQTQRESLYSIHQTEKLKQASGGTVPDKTAHDNRSGQFIMLLLGSLVLISLGGAGAWFAYNQYLIKTAPPLIATPQSRFIVPQSTTEIDTSLLSRDEFINAINENSSRLAPNELKHLVLRVGKGDLAPLMTTGQFFTTLQSTAPGNLVRALHPIFMIGSLGRHRFIIFNILSYDNSFGGMLNWEKAMPTDIGPIFETSSLLQNITFQSIFRDVVSKNKDVRVLSTPTTAEATSMAPVLMYSFFDNKKLIITDSLETLEILMDRLTAELLVH